MLPDDALEPTLLGSVRKHLWLVLSFAVTGAFLGVFVQGAFASDWTATATMLVENPESSQLFDQDAAASPERYAADQVVILDSTPVARRALEIVQDSARSTELTLDDMIDRVEVESGEESGLISVVASSADPELATAMSNATIAAYEEVKEAESSRGFESAIAEFSESIAAVDEELAQIAEDIGALRSPTGQNAEVQAQLQSAIQQLATLLSQPEAQTPAQLEVTLQQLEALQLISTFQGDDPAVASLNESRNQALERRSQLALRRDQLRVDAALTSTGIAMVSPAREATQSITTPRAMAMGLLAGLLLGVVVAYALASRSQRFNHKDEPELILNVPLLAEIPDTESEMETDLPVRDLPHSATAEAFRFALAGLNVDYDRRREGSDGRSRPSHFVGVVSPEAGEGNSIVTANLGAAAAARTRNVLLIDGDFGSPSLGQVFGIKRSADGITDVVESGLPLVEAVKRVDVGDGLTVDVLLRGTHSMTAPTFFRSPEIEAFFESLRSIYDLVLIDVPSPLQVAYSTSILALCDKTVTVVAHRSDVRSLADAGERLSIAGTATHGYLYDRWRRQRQETAPTSFDHSPVWAAKGPAR